MVFSSLLFVFAFLAICYGLYMIVPGIKARNMILLLFSLVFYAWGGPSFLVLLLLMTLVCYLGGLLIGRYQSRRKLWLVMTLVVCLGLLGYYKYTGFFLTNVQAIFGVPEVIPAITLPIGISFYTFQLLSYVIDVYRKEVPAQKNYLTLLLYAALFHQCIAGPIIRYSDVNEEIMERRIVRSDVAKGITRFASGLAKKALLANGCAAIVADLVEAPADFAGTPVEYLSTVSGAGILLAALCYMLEIYLDFSAYSDMAIGMGRMIGFHFKENFNYPYVAQSVTDFWRRWHISLSSFFRDYVYIPLGGNRCSKGRHIFNLLVVWALTGFWHGASWNFILWGLYFALFLVLEKYVFKWQKAAKSLTVHLRRLYTLAVVWFGWLLFRFDDMTLMGHALRSLIGVGNGFNGDNAHFTLKSYLFILIVAMIACTPIIPFLQKKLTTAAENRGFVGGVARTVVNVVAVVAPVALLVLSVLALVGDSYNPFLYFRF